MIRRKNYSYKRKIEQLIESKQKLERELSEQRDIIEQLLEEKCYSARLISDQDEYIKKTKIDIQNKAGHIELLLESERRLERELSDQNIELNNKKGHIEQLIESERKLSADINSILTSRSWKVASVFSSLSHKIFPLNSKRRKFAKFMINFFRHPL